MQEHQHAGRSNDFVELLPGIGAIGLPLLGGGQALLVVFREDSRAANVNHGFKVSDFVGGKLLCKAGNDLAAALAALEELLETTHLDCDDATLSPADGVSFAPKPGNLRSI